jgi:hypothetical protein
MFAARRSRISCYGAPDRTACAFSKPRLVFGTAGSTTKRRVGPEVCRTFGRGQKMPRFIPRGSLNQHLIRIEAPSSPLSSRPDPDFLPRGTKDDLVCGFHQGKPHELFGTHRALQEIRGSGRICSSLNQPRIRIEALLSFLSPSHNLEGELNLVLQLECASSNRNQFDVVVSLVQGEITRRPEHAP